LLDDLNGESNMLSKI